MRASKKDELAAAKELASKTLDRIDALEEQLACSEKGHTWGLEGLATFRLGHGYRFACVNCELSIYLCADGLAEPFLSIVKAAGMKLPEKDK